jgi:hypothetical protein
MKEAAMDKRFTKMLLVLLAMLVLLSCMPFATGNKQVFEGGDIGAESGQGGDEAEEGEPLPQPTGTLTPTPTSSPTATHTPTVTPTPPQPITMTATVAQVPEGLSSGPLFAVAQLPEPPDYTRMYLLIGPDGLPWVVFKNMVVRWDGQEIVPVFSAPEHLEVAGVDPYGRVLLLPEGLESITVFDEGALQVFGAAEGWEPVTDY